MKLDEAKEIKEKYHPMIQRLGIPGLYEADKLSIEALKRVKACRPVDFYAPEILLPGETQ